MNRFTLRNMKIRKCPSYFSGFLFLFYFFVTSRGISTGNGTWSADTYGGDEHAPSEVGLHLRNKHCNFFVRGGTP